MGIKRKGAAASPATPVTSLTGSDDPLRQFYVPPPELAQHFTQRTMTQFECHECWLEVRDWQLEKHWAWHVKLMGHLT
jgi:hypothetical protein